MKSKRGMHTRLLIWSWVLLLAATPGGIMAQSLDSGGEAFFRQEELDQMLAPIALYPDELLVQVLMAATYPLEVVQAYRWVQANPGLSADQIAFALELKRWDPSVKSLVNFPSVLQMMNDRLEWTQRLGDAFLDQKDQVMDTVQMLRWKAQAQGSLMTTNEQTVIVEPQTRTIVIEPATPKVIYVPVYNPTIVYGPWWWPGYPPYYYYPRGAIVAGNVIAFGLGVGVGVAWGYAWGGFNWHHHDVVINIERNVYINKHIDRNRYVTRVTTGSGGHGMWNHDPVHRRGVSYRSPAVGEHFGRGPLSGADARHDSRGFDRGGERRVTIQGPAHPPPQQPRVTTLPKAEPPRQPASLGRQGVQGQKGPTAFGGVGSGFATRQSSNRGHESLSSAGPSGSAPKGTKASPPGKGVGGGTSRGGGPRK